MLKSGPREHKDPNDVLTILERGAKTSGGWVGIVLRLVGAPQPEENLRLTMEVYWTRFYESPIPS